MKKIINAVADIVPEMVSGLVKSYPQLVEQIPNTQAIGRRDAAFKAGHQVGLVSGGGSGHEPLHLGYVGAGMLSAAIAGQINTSPTPDQIYAAIRYADHGAGVLLIVKNYAGDVMNFAMAQELAEYDDIQVKAITVDDDVAFDATDTQGRRGVAGTILVEKICGAAAEAGATLDELAALGQAVIDHTKTIGIALTAATVPGVDHPGFELQADEMEYGVGIHNERGYATEKMAPSATIAAHLVDKILGNFDLQATDEFAVVVNGLGATPLMEQYVFANDVLADLAKRDIKVTFTKVGNLVTAIDMHGVSLTLCQLQDNWHTLLNAPAATIAW
ncbi:MAG: dihydroxyacetone kinase subunit DhaK [Lactobacillus sp.]|jgi:dihydroxyacetone kinase-like protein|nr:dihydroxyacetone kinase subunit DhaK [Lactobacillus sp.]